MRVTQHAKERLRERVGLNRRAAERLSAIALEHGLTHQQATGVLEKLFFALYRKHQTADNIRIYAQKIFIFCGLTLVTVLPLHNKYKKVVAKAFQRRKDNA